MNATIHLDATARSGPAYNSWTFFGYDEPNYTYTSNGKWIKAKKEKIEIEFKLPRYGLSLLRLTWS